MPRSVTLPQRAVEVLADPDPRLIHPDLAPFLAADIKAGRTHIDTVRVLLVAAHELEQTPLPDPVE